MKRVGVAVALVAAGAACASSGTGGGEVCVIVDNRGGIRPLERVYLGNEHVNVRIGEVPLARARRFCTDRLILPGSYWLVIGGPYPEGRLSPDLFLEPGDLWTWNVRFNRLTCVEGGAIVGDC